MAMAPTATTPQGKSTRDSGNRTFGTGEAPTQSLPAKFASVDNGNAAFSKVQQKCFMAMGIDWLVFSSEA